MKQKAGPDKLMVVELRGNKHLTMFPTSIHPSGEEVRWEKKGEFPRMTWAEAKRKASFTAFLAIVLREYPKQQGFRDELCLALAGTLLRAGCTSEETDQYVTGVARLAGDEEWENRKKAQQTQACLEANEPATGLQRVVDLLGIPEYHDTFKKWVGNKTPVSQRNKARTTLDSPHENFRLYDGGKIIPNQHNIKVALNQLRITLRYDSFGDRLIVEGLEGFGPVMDDAALDAMWLRIDERFGFRATFDLFQRVVSNEARKNTFHPVQDYLNSLTWDGIPRLNTWLAEYTGAQNTSYTEAVGSIMLMAGVRRVRQPGCKFDEMVVLESPQGVGKSTALKILAVKDEWFSDDFPHNLDAQKIIERTSGVWLIEVAELAAFKTKDVEQLKATISRQVDRARKAYGRLPTTVPRQFTLFGTTNNDKYLNDATGARRFWPVRIRECKLKELQRDRDQLWAEAAYRESQGESIRLDSSLFPAAQLEQEQRQMEDPWTDVLNVALQNLPGKLRKEDAWDIIGLSTDLRNSYNAQRLNDCMKALGFEVKQRRFGGPPEWCYTRGRENLRINLSTNERGEKIGTHQDPPLTDEEITKRKIF